MWPTHEASLPRFRSKTYYEWFPMSVLQFLLQFLGWQSIGSRYIEGSVLVLHLPSYPAETEATSYTSLDWVWMEGSCNVISWQYPFYEVAFDMRKLINRVVLVPWTRSLTIWTPWTLRLRCRQNLFSTCIPCQQNWSMSVNVVASRMNYGERIRFR